MDEEKKFQVLDDEKLSKAAGGVEIPEVEAPVLEPLLILEPPRMEDPGIVGPHLVAPTRSVLACRKCGYICEVTFLDFHCPRCGCEDYYFV